MLPNFKAYTVDLELTNVSTSEKEIIKGGPDTQIFMMYHIISNIRI